MASLGELKSHGGAKVLRMPSRRKYSCIEAQRIRRIGVRFFNEDSSFGLKYLFSCGALLKEPQCVAKWLLTEERLGRTVIGEYLGSPNSFNLKVLEHYVSMQDLHHMPFIEAMREFMSNFRIPGEAQKIERILEVFARHYTTDCGTSGAGDRIDEESETSVASQVSAPVRRANVTPSNPDTAHILSYSVLMLNTDLHNNNVKQHMSKDAFIRNNRGIDDGNDIPAEILESIYSDVHSNEFQAKPDYLDVLSEHEKKIRNLDQRLVAPHRYFIMQVTGCAVADISKSQPLTTHSRVLFLFNDLLVITKKTAWSSDYIYKGAIALQSADFEGFSTPLFECGVEVMSRFHRKQLFLFNCDSKTSHRKFVHQTREMVSEAITIERLLPGGEALNSPTKLPVCTTELKQVLSSSFSGDTRQEDTPVTCSFDSTVLSASKSNNSASDSSVSVCEVQTCASAVSVGEVERSSHSHSHSFPCLSFDDMLDAGSIWDQDVKNKDYELVSKSPSIISSAVKTLGSPRTPFSRSALRKIVFAPRRIDKVIQTAPPSPSPSTNARNNSPLLAKRSEYSSSSGGGCEESTGDDVFIGNLIEESQHLPSGNTAHNLVSGQKLSRSVPNNNVTAYENLTALIKRASIFSSDDFAFIAQPYSMEKYTVKVDYSADGVSLGEITEDAPEVDNVSVRSLGEVNMAPQLPHGIVIPKLHRGLHRSTSGSGSLQSCFSDVAIKSSDEEASPELCAPPLRKSLPVRRHAFRGKRLSTAETITVLTTPSRKRSLSQGNVPAPLRFTRK